MSDRASGSVLPPLPPHPLVVDQETKLFRYATHADIRRWEHMELRYNNLLAALKELTDAV